VQNLKSNSILSFLWPIIFVCLCDTTLFSEQLEDLGGKSNELMAVVILKDFDLSPCPRQRLRCVSRKVINNVTFLDLAAIVNLLPRSCCVLDLVEEC